MAKCPRCIRGNIFRGSCIQCGFTEPEVETPINIPPRMIRPTCAKCHRSMRVRNYSPKDWCSVCRHEAERAGTMAALGDQPDITKVSGGTGTL